MQTQIHVTHCIKDANIIQTNKDSTRTEQPNDRKTDKGTAMVIIHKNTLKQKIDTFVQENQIIQVNKDPTESFQKQIQQKIHKFNTAIDKTNKNT